MNDFTFLYTDNEGRAKSVVIQDEDSMSALDTLYKTYPVSKVHSILKNGVAFYYGDEVKKMTNIIFDYDA